MLCRYGNLMIVLAALVLLPGCASIVTGRTQDVTINTNPQGAQCHITRENFVIATVPRTPAKVEIDRSREPVDIRCRYTGHAETSHHVKSELEPMVFGNVLIGGLLGWGIDVVTGADSRYESVANITLLPENPSAPLGAVAQGGEAAARPRQLAQAGPVTVGDVSQASWIAQRTASTNASNQIPTAPVGYVPPPPPPADKPAEKKPAETKPADKPVAALPTARLAAPPKAAAAPPKAAVAAMKAPATSTDSGLWRAHLASHRSEGAAINEWQELLKKDPKLYGDFDPKIEWVDVKDRGSFARLMLGGWAERKQADAACARIRGPRRYCAAVKE